MRRIAVGLLSVAFLLAGLAVAQEAQPGGDDPPVRLKKKVKPDAGEKAKDDQPKPADPPKDEPKDKPKDEPKMGDEPAMPDEPEADENEVLNRVGKNMRTSEDRLANRELNDSTRQVQEDILKDLDDLINREKNGGGGGGNDQQNQDQQNQQNQNPDQKQQAGGQKQGGKTRLGMGGNKGGKGQQQQQARAGQKPGGKKGQQGNGKQGDQQANAGGQGGQNGQKPQGQGQAGNMGGGGGQSQGPVNKLAEVYKPDDWGNLPQTMRAEMNTYSREQFMAKYNELIKQYYSTIAEKSRKKD
jgi:hypothetical protein